LSTRGIADFIVLISPNNLVYKTSVHSEYLCANSQAEYEPLQFGLQNLVDMGVKDIVAENSLVVVQKIRGEFQCFDISLNSYLDRCLDMIKYLHIFTNNLIPTDTNSRFNCLAHQASGYNISIGKFST
jgi:hypothetical protein